jgi:hypothetical protein
LIAESLTSLHVFFLLVQLDQPISKVRENELLFVYELDPIAGLQEEDEHEREGEGRDKEGVENEEGVQREDDRGAEADAVQNGREEQKEELAGAGEVVEKTEVAAPQTKKSSAEKGDAGAGLARGKLRAGPKPPRGSPRSSLPPPPPPPPPSAPPLISSPLLPLAAQAYAFGYNKRGSSSVVVSVVHRALDRVDSYFLNPFRCVKGPLTCEVDCDTLIYFSARALLSGSTSSGHQFCCVLIKELHAY